MYIKGLLDDLQVVIFFVELIYCLTKLIGVYFIFYHIYSNFSYYNILFYFFRYLKTFSSGVLEVLLKQLDAYRGGTWLPPRVLQQTLNYVNQAVSHAHTWRLLKPHMPAIISYVLFPLMSYSAEDEELWSVDPHEYIRVKFDVFEDFVSPVTAAQTLLHSACKKRKDMLQKTMELLNEILINPNTEPAQKVSTNTH